MKKLLFIVLDGAADIPCSDLGGKTPIEAASTPNMDFLASSGVNGLLYPVRPGFSPESDSATMSLLGYDTFNSYTGRGPLEAYGTGLRMKKGDLAFRVNFATTDGQKILDRRVRNDLTDAEASELADYLNKNLSIPGVASLEIRTFRGYRGVLILRSSHGKFSGNISNSDPGYVKQGPFGLPSKDEADVILKVFPLDESREAKAAAAASNAFIGLSSELLENHPINISRVQRGKKKANILLLRDAGDHLPNLKSIREKYGWRFGILADMPCEYALGKLMGMKIIKKNRTESYNEIAGKILKNLESLDALYVHLKGPDSAGHQKDAVKKKDVIEEIDRNFLAPLITEVNSSDICIVLTSDHATPCALGIHSTDPVPLTITGLQAKDSVEKFSEKSAKSGSLGYVMGGNLILLIKSYINSFK